MPDNPIGSGLTHDAKTDLPVAQTYIADFWDLSEFEVAYLAGHSKFETTRRFYLAVRRDLVGRARVVSEQISKSHLVAHLLRTPPFCPKMKKG